MSTPILRVRDKDGNVVDILAIVGPRGPEGPRGVGMDNITLADVKDANGKTLEVLLNELWQDNASMADAVEAHEEATNPHTGAAALAKTVAYKSDPLQIEDLSAVPSEPGIWLSANTVPSGAPAGWASSRNTVVRLRPGNDQYALDFLANYNGQKLAARIGATKDWFEFITSKGGVISGGKLDVTGDSYPLRLAGVDHVYLPFYRSGLGNARSGYIGYPNAASTAMSITNEVDGGAVEVVADGGMKVNGNVVATKADKPNSSYAGNGNSASRTVNVGGTGEVMLIYSQWGLALVTRRGSAIIGNAGGITWSSEALYSGGVLTMTSTHGALNTSGQTYYYQVL